MILSIDVGIKNLAFCIIDYLIPKNFLTYTIHLWDNYNIISDDKSHFNCQSLLKSTNLPCNKKCSYKYIENNNEIYCCKIHFPKNINKKKENKIKNKLIKNYILQDLIKLLTIKLNEIIKNNNELFEKITKVYIELQPRCNQKMKMISHIIYGKFIDLYSKKQNVIIKFVKASNKFKLYKEMNIPVLDFSIKNKYDKRKWLSIQYTKWILENKFSEDEKNKWYPVIFENSKIIKIDDLCDTFLQSLSCS
jgi:hypothetical protein